MYLKGLYGNMFYFGRKKEKNQNKNHMLYKCVMQWCIDLNYTIWKSYRVIGTWKRWPISTSKHFFLWIRRKNLGGLYINTPKFCWAFVLILRFPWHTGLLNVNYHRLKTFNLHRQFYLHFDITGKKSNKISIYLEPVTLNLLSSILCLWDWRA